MSRRVLGTVTTGIVAGAATYALLASGVLGGAAGALGNVVRPPAAAAAEGLPAFTDCERLRRWHVATSLRDVGPWGVAGSPMFASSDVAVSMAASDAGTAARSAAATVAGSPEAAVGAGSTGTNVQEAGVDEPDVAKTDGRLLVRISGRSLVVTDVSGAQPRELSRRTLVGTWVPGAELLLRGNRVVVVGHQGIWPAGAEPWFDSVRLASPVGVGAARTRLLSFDISDPSAPRLVDARSVGGALVSARLHPDGTVRVALTTAAPELRFVHPDGQRTAAEATRENRRILRAAPASAWLPAVRVGSGPARPLLGCDEVRHPHRPSGPGTVTVVSFAIDAPENDSATAVTASGDLVYASARRLYVATYGGRTTSVHAFALAAGRTSYAASGSVPGVVKDRWSFSEHDGHLRVTTTSAPTTSRRVASAVRVLAERGGRLEEIGHVEGLGVDEQVQSVRWFGDLAVVVTFRQTDPLFTVDLAEPTRPRLLGALKVPGFSSYLHPVGGDLLVGLGRDATLRGIDRGAQAATFDLHDRSDVRRTDTLDLGRDTWLAAGEDPRSVSYLPEERLLVTAASSWRDGRSRFVALHVSPAGELTRGRSWPMRPAFTGARALPLGEGRVALVDGGVRVVQVG